MIILPFEHTDRDFDRFRRLRKAVMPHDPMLTMERVRFSHADAMKKATVLEQFKLERDGEFIAYVDWLEPWWVKGDDLMLFQLYVHPDEQGRGLGGRLLGKVVEGARRHGRPRLGGQTFDRYPGSVSFLENRGFKSVQSNARSFLDSSRALPDELWEGYERVKAGGIEFVDGVALEARFPDDWRERWWRLAGQVDRDVPTPNPREPIPFESWATRFNGPDFDLRSQHFALDEDDLVGMTGLQLYPADPTFAGITITGVLRSHRRRGIAMALKLESIRNAKAMGIERIMTENESDNPMLNINLLLGFEVGFNHLQYQADVEEVAQRLDARIHPDPQASAVPTTGPEEY